MPSASEPAAERRWRRRGHVEVLLVKVKDGTKKGAKQQSCDEGTLKETGDEQKPSEEHPFRSDVRRVALHHTLLVSDLP